MLLTNICSFLSSGPRTFDVRREPMTCFDQWNVTGSHTHHFRAETWKNQYAVLHILHIPASISGCWWGFSQVFFAGWCAHLAAAVTAGVLLFHSCPYLSRTKSTKSEASQLGQAQLCHEWLWLWMSYLTSLNISSLVSKRDNAYFIVLKWGLSE